VLLKQGKVLVKRKLVSGKVGCNKQVCLATFLSMFRVQRGLAVVQRTMMTEMVVGLTKGGRQSNTEKRFKPSIREETKTEIMKSLLLVREYVNSLDHLIWTSIGS